MSSFILNACNDTKVVLEYSVSEGYSFSPKSKTKEFTKIKKVSIYDPKRIENVVINKYTLKYKRLAKIIKDILDSDDEEEADYMICLDEIAKLKDILLIKYRTFLKKEMFEYFLKDLFFLEQVLQERMMEYRTNAIIERSGR